MADVITLTVDGRGTIVVAGATVAAAVAIASAAHGAAGSGATRRSVSGQARAPLCGMGVCQECRVTIDGRAHVLSCQTLCLPGMDVRTGAAV